MVVNDRRKYEDIHRDSIVIALSPGNIATPPCLLLRLNKTHNYEWTLGTVATFPNYMPTVLVNCFITPDNYIFVILEDIMILLDKSFVKIRDLQVSLSF